MEPGSLVMERKMLLGIKQRAERTQPPDTRRIGSGRSDHAPPGRAVLGVDRRQQLRIVEHVVTSEAGDHPVVDRPGPAHQLEHPPQRACVELRAGRVVPLVEPAIALLLVAVEPQLRDEAGEADEQRRVEDALPQEYPVPAAAEHAEAELNDEEGRVVGRVAVDDGLAEDPRR